MGNNQTGVDANACDAKVTIKNSSPYKLFLSNYGHACGYYSYEPTTAFVDNDDKARFPMYSKVMKPGAEDYFVHKEDEKGKVWKTVGNVASLGIAMSVLQCRVEGYVSVDIFDCRGETPLFKGTAVFCYYNPKTRSRNHIGAEIRGRGTSVVPDVIQIATTAHCGTDRDALTSHMESQTDFPDLVVKCSCNNNEKFEFEVFQGV